MLNTLSSHLSSKPGGVVTPFQGFSKASPQMPLSIPQGPLGDAVLNRQILLPALNYRHLSLMTRTTLKTVPAARSFLKRMNDLN